MRFSICPGGGVGVLVWGGKGCDGEDSCGASGARWNIRTGNSAEGIGKVNEWVDIIT